MFITILGAAAGGGLPQWNCRCPNCLSARAGSPDVPPMTQSSVAVSSDGANWFLLNVSPDVRQQILDCPELAPPDANGRGTGIAGCVLTDAELDHTAGLLLLREGSVFSVYSTPVVHRWLNAQFPIEPVLSAFSPHPWHVLEDNTRVNLCSGTGEPSTLWVTPIELDAHPPLFVGDVDDAAGSVIGLRIEDEATGGVLVFAPGVETINDALTCAVEGADALFFDGTCWTDDELIRLGFSRRSSKQMGHLPVSGADGSLRWLESLPVKHKVLFHINNTNPMLNRTSAEYKMVEQAGVRIGADGDRFEL